MLIFKGGERRRNMIAAYQTRRRCTSYTINGVVPAMQREPSPLFNCKARNNEYDYCGAWEADEGLLADPPGEDRCANLY